MAMGPLQRDHVHPLSFGERLMLHLIAVERNTNYAQ